MGLVPQHILLARFQIRPDLLRGKEASLLDCVWSSPLNAFIEHHGLESVMAHPYEQMRAYRRLNTAIIAQSLPIVHGFEPFAMAHFENEPLRCLLSLESDAHHLPSPSQLQYIVGTWAQHWLQSAFTKAGQGNTTQQRDLLERLSDLIQSKQPVWYQQDVYDLWGQQEDGRRYRAIPSILAALLHNQVISIDDEPVTLRLALDRATNNYMVVSDPLLAEFPVEDKQGQETWHWGTFAYKLRFLLHTFAGSQESWIHLWLSCTRYIDQAVTKLPRGESMTIQMRTSKARKEGWNVAQTLVPLSAITYTGIHGIQWGDALPDLLARLEVRSLLDPKTILADPARYRFPSAASQWDQFLPVHAASIKPSHAIQTGLGAQERAEIVHSILPFVEELLIPCPSLQRDTKTTQVKKVLTLMPWEDLREHASQEQLAERISQALHQRALGGKPLTLLICWYTQRTKETAKQQLRRLLFLSNNEPWPQWLTLIEHEIPEELVEPLNMGSLDPEDFYNKARPKDFFVQWKSRLELARFQRLHAWERHVWSEIFVESDGYKLVLIEVPRISKKMHPSLSPKGILRRAALTEWQAGSQMLHPMSPRYDEEQHPLEENTRSSQGRIKNALADLLFRQTGVIFDLPGAIYAQQAKLPTEIANDLTVIGLSYARKNKTDQHPRIAFPLAVRLQPSATIELCLPEKGGAKGAWLPYKDATIAALGPRFASEQGLVYSPTESLTFLRDILLEQRNQPTLLLVLASDWRASIWPQLRNTHLHDPHVLEINNPACKDLPFLIPMTPETNPNVRVIRLRERGTGGETPQYIAMLEQTTWDQVPETRELRSAFGCLDTSIKSPYLHYLSIAQQSKMASRQDRHAYKHEKGGAIAFRYQSILEIVPIFLQPTDDPLCWARIPHFLRKSPAWDGGGLLLPYPLHLVQKAIEDCMVLFGEIAQSDEEEEDDE